MWLFRRIPLCPLCGKTKNEQEMLCVSCRQKINNFQQHNPLLAGDFLLYRVASYKDFRQVHLRFKYGGQTQLAKTMAMLMLQTYLACISDASQLPDLITYVPSTRVRLGQRGYNTAELLAKWLGRYMDRPVKLLLKRKNSPKQTNLGTMERQENIRGVFAVKGSIQKLCINSSRQRIMLVDDVYTSGATMSEAVCTLSASGYAYITGICFLSKH